MKKTLLSVMAGLTVVGSASAAPTPEERKELCQLLIDKGTHVWVEKTQACIPSGSVFFRRRKYQTCLLHVQGSFLLCFC